MITQIFTCLVRTLGFLSSLLFTMIQWDEVCDQRNKTNGMDAVILGLSVLLLFASSWALIAAVGAVVVEIINMFMR